jgi:hypothetical protein
MNPCRAKAGCGEYVARSRGAASARATLGRFRVIRWLAIFPTGSTARTSGRGLDSLSWRG